MSHCTLFYFSLIYKEKKYYTTKLNLINKLIYTFKNSTMNKYTKNIIFFNLEKIIALTTVLTIVILTISLLSS